MGQHGGMTVTPPTAALILAGGRGTRMGGVDKPGLLVHGRRLLDIALSATAHLDAVVVVGPHRPELDARITQTQESPIGAGPVAAIWAGLSETGLSSGLTEDALVVVLASDLPHIEADRTPGPPPRRRRVTGSQTIRPRSPRQGRLRPEFPEFE